MCHAGCDEREHRYKNIFFLELFKADPRAGRWNRNLPGSQKYGASRSVASCRVIPSALTRFRDRVAPETTVTDATGIPRTSARHPITSRLALPCTGGDRTEQRMLLRQGSYPDRNPSLPLEGDTSREMTTPVPLAVTASRKDSIGSICSPGSEKEVSPGSNKHGSPVAVAVPHPFNASMPGGACRAPGLSRGSPEGIYLYLTRGPMGAPYRHGMELSFRGYNPFRGTSANSRGRSPRRPPPPRLP